jgi:hypothetical protein
VKDADIGHDVRVRFRPRLAAVAALGVLTAAVLPAVPASAAVPLPRDDPFYRYTGSTPLASI